MLEFQFLKQKSSFVVEWVENNWILSHTSKYRRLGGKNRHLANFDSRIARVLVFEANEFFSGWNEFRMIEYPLMPVYTADSAVKTAV